MLRAAILRNYRPTTLLLRVQPHSKWKRLDFILLHAFQIFQDETSSNHGLPVWISRSTDPSIRLVVEEREDVADRLLAQWDEKNRGNKRKIGVSRFVSVLDESGKPLEYGGLTRQRFQQAAIQEQRDQAEDEFDEFGIERDRPEGGYNPADYGDGLTTPA